MIHAAIRTNSQIRATYSISAGAAACVRTHRIADVTLDAWMTTQMAISVNAVTSFQSIVSTRAVPRS